MPGSRPEVWVHGDLLPGNPLVVDGRLSAVIDFGGPNVGDPACDLQPAWNVSPGDSRLSPGPDAIKDGKGDLMLKWHKLASWTSLEPGERSST
ncbi:phosphotransferase [Streptosporangium sp. H16]|uniref:phosphotransferase n=1 Tax=Streptosporangium sp. H16 TaxID=3444184 RepID=UPI003F7A2592